MNKTIRDTVAEMQNQIEKDWHEKYPFGKMSVYFCKLMDGSFIPKAQVDFIRHTSARSMCITFGKDMQFSSTSSLSYNKRKVKVFTEPVPFIEACNNLEIPLTKEICDNLRTIRTNLHRRNHG